MRIYKYTYIYIPFPHDMMFIGAASRRWITSAIFLEHSQGRLAAASNRAAIRAARLAGSETTVGILAVPSETDVIVAQAQRLSGLSSLIVAVNARYDRLMPEATATLLLHLQRQNNYSHWWAAHTSTGKNVLPRFAGLLLREDEHASVAPIADVTKVVDGKTFERPIYAGNAIATVQSSAAINLITVRPTAFQATEQETDAGAPPPTEIIKPDVPEEERLATWIGEELSKSDRPELSSAEIVVAGGRALKSADNFKLLYDLADALGGAAGIPCAPSLRLR